MKFTRVYSKRTRKFVMKIRFRDPRTGKPTDATYPTGKELVAKKLHNAYIEKLELQLAGVPSSDGWRTSYEELVKRFLQEAPISSEERQTNLKRVLDRNDLELTCAADLNNIGALTAKARALAKARGHAYVVGVVQQVLKQLSKWAFENSILETDPLLRWRRMEGYVKEKRDSYTDEECAAIIKAAKEWDTYQNRQHGTDRTLLTLVTSGNRPSAVFNATVADLQADRIRLAPGCGKKFNGACTLPAELIAQLRMSAQHRGPTGYLLVSPEGQQLGKDNFGKRTFRPAAILAFTHELWPHAKEEARECLPIEVAEAILHGRPRGFDGPKPTDPAKIKARVKRAKALETLRKELAPAVKAKLNGRPFYAFCRHTHETLASRAGVHPHAIDAQIGHDGQGTGARHYLDTDQLNPLASSTAVYNAIMAKLEPKVEVKEEPLLLAVGAETTGVRAVDRAVEAASTVRTGKSTAVSYSQPIDSKGLGLVEAKGVEPSTSALRTPIDQARTTPINARTIGESASNSDLQTTHNSAQIPRGVCSGSCSNSRNNDLDLEAAIQRSLKVLKDHIATAPEATKAALLEELANAIERSDAKTTKDTD